MMATADNLIHPQREIISVPYILHVCSYNKAEQKQ